MEYTDNYQALMDKWQSIIAGMDLRLFKERYQMEEDEAFWYLIYFHQKYAIDKRTAKIHLVGQEEHEMGFNELMCIYHMFYYCKEDAGTSGNFVPFRLVKRAAPFEAAYQRTILHPLQEVFDGHAAELKKACEALGGTPIRQGDVGYQIMAACGIPLIITFWDGDDEFPAQANILFDDNITSYLHEETVVSLAAELARRLTEEAGIGQAEHLLGAEY